MNLTVAQSGITVSAKSPSAGDLSKIPAVPPSASNMSFADFVSNSEPTSKVVFPNSVESTEKEASEGERATRKAEDETQVDIPHSSQNVEVRRGAWSVVDAAVLLPQDKQLPSGSVGVENFAQTEPLPQENLSINRPTQTRLTDHDNGATMKTQLLNAELKTTPNAAREDSSRIHSSEASGGIPADAKAQPDNASALPNSSDSANKFFIGAAAGSGQSFNVPVTKEGTATKNSNYLAASNLMPAQSAQNSPATGKRNLLENSLEGQTNNTVASMAFSSRSTVETSFNAASPKSLTEYQQNLAPVPQGNNATSKPSPRAESSGASATGLTAQTKHPVSAGVTESFDLLLAPAQELEATQWDAPRMQVAHAASAMSPRAEIAPHIARQLVDGMGQATHRPTEIALSPEELGRVRMSVATEDGKITVSILTERPETLELMRRHIDQLGQSFRSMGYENISFSFGQGTQSGDQSSTESPAQSPHDKPASATGTGSQDAGATIVNLDSAPSAGIDIRL